MRHQVPDLPSYWSTFTRQTKDAPFLHPKDREYLDSIEYWARHPNAREKLSFNTYLRSARFGKRDGEFHFSLLPSPFVGDLANADVVILLLNPGFADVDYYAEYAHPEYRERLDRTLQQDFRGTNFPFLHLDPTFCWAGGFRWWEGKLRTLLQALANKRFKGDYYRALEFAARRLASIELIPYHSSNFKEGSFIKCLPSAQVARGAAKLLERRARNGELVIVATRRTSAWGLTETPDRIVCYNGSAEARSAYLTPNSRGGRMILAKLLAL